jgi:hypothetical protein
MRTFGPDTDGLLRRLHLHREVGGLLSAARRHPRMLSVHPAAGPGPRGISIPEQAHYEDHKAQRGEDETAHHNRDNEAPGTNAPINIRAAPTATIHQATIDTRLDGSPTTPYHGSRQPTTTSAYASRDARLSGGGPAEPGRGRGRLRPTQ